MYRVACLVWAAGLTLAPQAPSGPESRWSRERVWFARLTREDLDWDLRKGVASEGVSRFGQRLAAEIAEALADCGGGCVWIGPQPIEKRTRIVGLGAGEAGRKEDVEKRLKAIRFLVDWLEVTVVEVADKGSHVDFAEIGGAFVGMNESEGGRYLVPHLPKCKPERLLAFSARAGGKILWDAIPLEIVSGDPGIGGTRVQRALDGLSGVRLVPPGAKADRFTVEVEMRALPEVALRSPVRRGDPARIGDLGAPSAPVLGRLRKGGIEAREAK